MEERPHKRYTRYQMGLATIVLAAGAVFPHGHAAATTLRVQINADIRSTDPGINRDATTDSVILHMVEGLVGYNAKGETRPLLAKTVDVSPDRRSYTFHLREHVKFHNGATLSADDVVWSWNRYMSPKSGWRCLPDFDGRKGFKVVDIKAVDEHTVLFTLNHPNPLFLTTMARSDCGMSAITHRDSVRPDGSWDKPIGTGPFKLKEWKHREYISLTSNADYVSPGEQPDGYVGSKRPMVDEIRFLVIPDLATAKAALLQGSIDILTRLPYNEAAELQKNPNVTVSTSSMLASFALLLQTSDPALSNLKLRQAIASALDYEQLVQNVTYGLGAPNNSVVPTSSPYYTEAEKKGHRYGLEHAKKLLKESGYRGQPLKIIANKQYTYLFDSAVIAQAMLQQVGINAQIEVLEWGTQLDRWQKGNYQLMAFPYSSRMDPALNFETIIGDREKQPRKVWDDPQAIKLLAQATEEPDTQVRQTLFDQLHQGVIEQVPLIVLASQMALDAAQNSVVGYKASIFGSPILWEVSKK